MRRPRAAIARISALVALGLTLAACGGSDDDKATTSPATTEAPSQDDTAPRPSGALPPEFVKCMADKGFDIRSPADIHTAPQEAFQACLGSLHQGGGTR